MLFSPKLDIASHACSKSDIIAAEAAELSKLVVSMWYDSFHE